MPQTHNQMNWMPVDGGSSYTTVAPFHTHMYTRGNKLILPEHERWKLKRKPFEREMDMFDYCARKGINPKFVNPCTMLICWEDDNNEEDGEDTTSSRKQQKYKTAVKQDASFSVLRLLLGNDDQSFDIAKHILPPEQQDPRSVLEF